MTVEEFADATGWSLTYVRKHIKLGDIPITEVVSKLERGRSLIFDIDEDLVHIWRKEVKSQEPQAHTRKARHRRKRNFYKDLTLKEYMHLLCKWCEQHPDSDIRNYDYGKATLEGLIQ